MSYFQIPTDAVQQNHILVVDYAATKIFDDSQPL